ncbi:uncharacterized protein [Phaseolus vulgaris]|uniref:uncharacterized protein n=1 Tax=Phaseolus vulgaris TaxID=3885 RepID=UPI0035CABEE6
MAEGSAGFLIPWTCLMDRKVCPDNKVYSMSGQRKTFAQALGNTCDIPLSQLPTPCIKGDMIAVQIDEADYLAGLEDCKTHLHGRVILSKGDKPLTHLDLTKKLQPVWKALGPWKAIPLGKGFYEFEFASIEDMRWALGMGSLKLSPGLLRLFAWTKDFVPATMKSTKAQTWVRIYHLPLEYWKPKTIYSIVRGLGTPLSLDEHTMRKNRGMFARVLVDIDLLSPLSDQLLVERPDFAFVAGVEYEWLPPFCSHCKMIGHELAQCRAIHDQGRVLGPQHKPSQKASSDERDQGRIPKQRKEYRKKDPETKLVEGLIDKLKVDETGGG